MSGFDPESLIFGIVKVAYAGKQQQEWYHKGARRWK
jgi:hypothetical protein